LACRAFEHFSAGDGHFALVTGKFLRLDGDAVQPGAAVFKIIEDLLAHKATGQITQLGHGFVINPAVARHINRPHRPQIQQIPQSLAGRALAHVEPVAEVVLRQGTRGNKQKAVNFGDGGRLVQRAGKLHKEMDDINLHRV
jgi:hypothetical protein